MVCGGGSSGRVREHDVGAGQKREALAAHASQKAWLDASQGMDSYLRAMDQNVVAVGKIVAPLQTREGWRGT